MFYLAQFPVFNHILSFSAIHRICCRDGFPFTFNCIPRLYSKIQIMTLRGLALVMFLSSSLFGRARVSGYCEQGGQVVVTAAQQSTTKVQQSYPSCTITVYLTGTVTPSTIYADNSGTSLANPFSASKTGYWFFYINNGTYDIKASGGGIPAPITWGAVSVFDPFSFASVEDYGAFGDGINSDCPGFQNAIASGVKTIFATQSTHYYLPCTLTFLSGQAMQWGAGVHTINGIIIPDSTTLKTAGNVSFIGQGSAVTMLQQIAGANQDFIRSNSFYALFDTGNKFGVNGLTLKGITIDGNAANQTLATVNISGVASTTPLAVTTGSSHGYSTGQVVCQRNVGGKPEADGCFTIFVTGATTYTLVGSQSISTNTYTSGGVATNGHENCLALYGIGYNFDDYIIQNCKVNGILSGWDVENADNYMSTQDRTAAMLSHGRVMLNGFDGIRWHGPHDTYIDVLDAFSNGGWALANDTMITGSTVLATSSMNIVKVNVYGNTQGAIWDNGTMYGDGVTPSLGVYGLYIGPNGGGSILTTVSINSLEVNSPWNIISGACFNSSASCVKLAGGNNNTFNIDGAITGGFIFSEYAESGPNYFHSRAALNGGSTFFDAAHLYSSSDLVDTMGTAAAAADLMIDPRQYHLTISTGTAPLVVASTTPVDNLTASWPLYSGGGSQFTNAREVIGVATLVSGSPSSVTITFSVPFTSVGSYICTLGLNTGSNTSATYSAAWHAISASQISIWGPNSVSDTWAYDCKGN